ncbi:radical SAM protein [Paenibacillus tepidiphilus]|uniref:radical SAM protein n=1 Tax=Paenibacillus tepidiphilus TaxID=2608683 RepID=UPI00123B485E|nr:radical SAM protein [Paenibacillus tepidiphilus]
MHPFIPNIYKLEIDITYLCTLKCHNCNRGISVAPPVKEHNMSVEQIRRFIDQSITSNHPWEQIKLIGGEPTIHPQIDIIIELLYTYKADYNKQLDLRVVSNGTTSFTRNKLDQIQTAYPDIIIENSGKVDNFIPGFSLSHIAPRDIYAFKNHRYRGCWVSEECGIGLNFSGFYCCSIGGSIARLFNHEIAVRNVEDLNFDTLMNMYDKVCSLCGMYHNLKATGVNDETILSPTWQNQIDNLDPLEILPKY